MRWRSCYRTVRTAMLWLLFAGLWWRVSTFTSWRDAGNALILLAAAVAAQVVVIVAWVRHNRRLAGGNDRRRRRRVTAADLSHDVLGRRVELAPGAGWCDRHLIVTVEGGRKVYRPAGGELL